MESEMTLKDWAELRVMLDAGRLSARDVERWLVSSGKKIPSSIFPLFESRYSTMESLHADSAISRWELSAEEKKWAEGGNKIEAIKLHRKRTSCTLKESKDIIENYIEKYLMDRGDLRRRPLSEMLLRWGRLKDKHDTYNIILGPDDIISIEKELMRPIGPSELKRLLMGLFSGEVKLIKGR